MRLHEAPLAIDLLVEDLVAHPPRPGDGPAPDVLDHRPGVAQALGVRRLQLVALGPQPDALGTAAFHVCSLRGGTTSIPLRRSPPLIGLRGAGMAARYLGTLGQLGGIPWRSRTGRVGLRPQQELEEAFWEVSICDRDCVLGER